MFPGPRPAFHHLLYCKRWKARRRTGNEAREVVSVDSAYTCVCMSIYLCGTCTSARLNLNYTRSLICPLPPQVVLLLASHSSTSHSSTSHSSTSHLLPRQLLPLGLSVNLVKPVKLVPVPQTRKGRRKRQRRWKWTHQRVKRRRRYMCKKDLLQRPI